MYLALILHSLLGEIDRGRLELVKKGFERKIANLASYTMKFHVIHPFASFSGVTRCSPALEHDTMTYLEQPNYPYQREEVFREINNQYEAGYDRNGGIAKANITRRTTHAVFKGQDPAKYLGLRTELAAISLPTLMGLATIVECRAVDAEKTVLTVTDESGRTVTYHIDGIRDPLVVGIDELLKRPNGDDSTHIRKVTEINTVDGIRYASRCKTALRTTSGKINLDVELIVDQLELDAGNSAATLESLLEDKSIPWKDRRHEDRTYAVGGMARTLGEIGLTETAQVC
jgi:hypothetical protein